jgi:regulator of protease activity HflC (stomatin/prohibitin superfamily)
MGKYLVGLIVALLVAIFGSFMVIGYVDSTEYVVKQGILDGQLDVKSQPGPYGKWFGKISEYPRTGSFSFSSEDLDAGVGVAPLQASFQGGSTADITGVLKFRLPTSPEKAINLHRDYKNAETVRLELIRNSVSAAIKQAGPLFTAEEAFIFRRAEFTKTVRDIIEHGEFLTETIIEQRKSLASTDSSDGLQVSTVTRFKIDSAGNRIVTKPSVLKDYGIEIVALDIKNFDFDKATEEFIESKKKSMAMRVASEATAIAAKQTAITAEAEGAAMVAKAKAEAEVQKIKEVTQAEKERDVARLNAQKALAVSDSIASVGRANAEAARLAVNAGLSPKERAEFEMKTKIGVAEALSNVKFPSSMVISGGGSSGNGANPFDAVGLKALYDLSNKMGSSEK